MCCLAEIASSLWEEVVVDAGRSSLNANVSSLSRLAEGEQEIQANRECSLQATKEAPEEPIELYSFQYNPVIDLFRRLTGGCAAPPPTS